VNLDTCELENRLNGFTFLHRAGGSLPLSVITANLSTVTMTVPIANYDDNQHAENENLRLQNLWDGIETVAAIMAMK